jgi:hypothetical protein
MPKNKEVALIIVLLEGANCYISLCGRRRVWRARSNVRSKYGHYIGNIVVVL